MHHLPDDATLVGQLRSGLDNADTHPNGSIEVGGVALSMQQAASRIEALPLDCRLWPYYPIEMPLTASGDGPATIGQDAASLTYEVWDRTYTSHGSFSNLPEAINTAMRLSLQHLLAQT